MLSEYALELMNQAVRDANQAEAEARIDLVHRADEYYQGRTESETVSYFDPGMIQQIAYGNNNITARVIKRISQVHKVRPLLIFPEDANQNAIATYTEATKTKAAKMPRAERMLNLQRLIMLKSTFRSGRLEIDVIKDFVPIMGDDPMVPIAVCYPIHASSEVTDASGEVWGFVSATEQFRYNKGGTIIEGDDELEGVNPYGVMPVVFCFEEGAPPETEFMDVEPAMDLVEANLAVNLALTEMNANIRFQNFDYPYLTNIKNVGDVTISQDKFTELPPGVEMGVVGFSSHVADTVSGIQFHYKSVSMNYGLDAKFVEGVGVESGKALQLRNQELMDNRSGSLENWRNIWDALYQIEKVQMKYHFKVNMPDTMDVDFRETMKIQTEKEKREDADWLVATGQTTYAQIMIDSNPDAFPGDPDATPPVTPLEQAQQFMLENLRKNSLAESAAAIPTALGLALQQTPEGVLE